MATVHYQRRVDSITGERKTSLHHLTGEYPTLTLCGKRLRGAAWSEKEGEVTCPTCAKGEQRAYTRRF